MWKPTWLKPRQSSARPPSATPLTDEELIEKVAQEVVARRLAAPALFLLEASRPLSFVASQGLVFLAPFVEAALDLPEYETFINLVEKRENIEKLQMRIEELEEERLARGREKSANSAPGQGT